MLGCNLQNVIKIKMFYSNVEELRNVMRNFTNVPNNVSHQIQ